MQEIEMDATEIARAMIFFSGMFAGMSMLFAVVALIIFYYKDKLL